MKSSIEELTIFGGAPSFAQPLHVGRPNIGRRERLLDRIGQILDDRWLTNDGRHVRELEGQVASRLGVKHCVTTCNATAALQIALRALGLSGEIILPSFTFIATAHAATWIGCRPIFCDVEPRSYTIDPSQVESLVTDQTVAILGVHLWGRACAVESLEELARRRGLRLVFDAAHAFGCSRGGRMIGGFGDAEVLSFHATKVVNAFEGGAITTNRDDVADAARLIRNHGFRSEDNVEALGINGKMSEVAAAMGLTSLECLDELVAVNRRNYSCYLAELDGLRGVTLLRYPEAERHNYHYIVVEIDHGSAGLTRDQAHEILNRENVLARRYFHPGCHRSEPYRQQTLERRLVVTERASERCLSLPTGTAIGPEEIREVCGLLRLIVEQSAQVSARWSR